MKHKETPTPCEESSFQTLAAALHPSWLTLMCFMQILIKNTSPVEVLEIVPRINVKFNSLHLPPQL